MSPLFFSGSLFLADFPLWAPMLLYSHLETAYNCRDILYCLFIDFFIDFSLILTISECRTLPTQVG